MYASLSKTITAENQFTGWTPLNGSFQIDITGITNSTVTFQRSRDKGVTVHDIQQFAAETFYHGMVGNSKNMYRIGIKTGDYGSDTVNVNLEA